MSRAVRLVRAVCVCAVAVTVPGLAHAQVYKCVDRAGRTTYQQVPCPDTQKGGRLSLSTDHGSTRQDDAAATDLETLAARKKILPGMARALVVKAHGMPQEMRAGQAGEDAAEVWIYRKPELKLRIGFRAGLVTWVNDNAADPEPEPPPDAAAGATPRQALARGMPCGPLQHQIGNATSLEEDYDSALTRTVLRMIWQPTETEPERLVVTCDRGVIARVDRTAAP